ncbi:glycosyltransferase [bacterium]|nr:glycosyltransferase [bacterium]
MKGKGPAFLDLDYPGLQFILLDDRSTDATRSLLEQAARGDSRVRVVGIDALPSGWLGKNHALNMAANLCATDLLLFADIDAEISSDFLKRAVRLLEKDRLDYLTAMAQLKSSSIIALPVLGSFAFGFMLALKPWLGKNPRSDKATGIGAFGLVRRSAYLASGGHEPIRLRPDDDLRIAKLLKKRGFKVDCVWGWPGVRVDWYESIWAMARGLEKNTFAAFEYSLVQVVVGLVSQIGVLLLPYILLLTCSGLSRAFAALSVLALSTAYLSVAVPGGFPVWTALCLPFAAASTFFIFTRAVVLTLWNQGIYWRDSFYSLKELKKNQD